MGSLALCNANLVQGDNISPVHITIEDGYIKSLVPSNNKIEASQRIDCENLYVSHGFIDIHTHGAGGCDFMDATEDAFIQISKTHAKFGATGLLATTVASTRKGIFDTFSVYEKVKKFTDGARFLGIHLEGPYLNIAQCGAQDPKSLRAANSEEYLEFLAACPDIKRWTIAPEIDGGMELGKLLHSKGIVASIGHSDADYDTVLEAVENGFSNVTHLYSGVSTITRKSGFRIAGVLEAAYMCDELSVEIIADGCHLPKSLLQMAVRFKGVDNVALITDSIRAAGTPVKESILGNLEAGQRVIIEDGVAKLPDRTSLAGSVATADRLVKNMVELAEVSLPQAIKMITATPAKILGLSHSLGSVAVNRRADLVVFDKDINVKLTIVGGKIVYKA